MDADIGQLKGMDLSEAVAREVMGYVPRKHESGSAWTEPHGKSWRFGVPDFAENVEDAWKVVQQINKSNGWLVFELHHHFVGHDFYSWRCTWRSLTPQHPGGSGEGHDECAAICRAALACVRGLAALNASKVKG